MSHDHLQCDLQMMRHRDTNRMDVKNLVVKNLVVKNLVVKILDGKMMSHHVIHRKMDGPMTDDQKMI